MPPRRLLDQDLQIKAFAGQQGMELCLAQRVDACHLEVQLVATPALIRLAALKMLQGPLDADFDGQPLRLMHFTIHNQNDRTRLVFTAEHASKDGGGRNGPLPAGP